MWDSSRSALTMLVNNLQPETQWLPKDWSVDTQD